MAKLILFVEDDAQFRVVFAHAIREALAEVLGVEPGLIAEPERED